MAETILHDYDELYLIKFVAPVIIKINLFGEKIFAMERTGLYFWQGAWWSNLFIGIAIVVGWFIFVVIINKSAAKLDEIDARMQEKADEKNRFNGFIMVLGAICLE